MKKEKEKEGSGKRKDTCDWIKKCKCVPNISHDFTEMLQSSTNAKGARSVLTPDRWNNLYLI